MTDTTTIDPLPLPEPHPCLPFPPEHVLLHATRDAEGRALYRQFLNYYAARLKTAEDDPLYRGFKLDCWKLNDEQIADPDVEILCIFGCNRLPAKTWWSVKTLCEAARAYPGYEGWLLAETDDNSVGIHQRLVWKFLRPYIGRLNGKRHVDYKVNYSEANGFTEGLLVIPSGPREDEKGHIIGYEGISIIQFKSYKSDPGQLEGRELGARLRTLGQTAGGNPVLALKKRRDGSFIQNIGAVADEAMSLAWFRPLARRIRYRNAKLLWPFTPINGITPSIKTVVGVPRLERTAPVNVEDGTGHRPFGGFVANVKGCPRGHMPVLAGCQWPRTKAIWHHWNAQSFNNYSEIVRQDCEGKISDYIERMAFGYARDAVALQFGQFCDAHIVRKEHLPAHGTNYQINDPHDDRPWFSIWVRVVNGLRGIEYYIYRDWPDARTYGEWAVETERETNDLQRRGWDGDPGPAQANLNLGVLGYKRLWKQLESIPAVIRGPLIRDVQPAAERDPYRRRIQESLGNDQAGSEEVFERIIDSRAAPRPHIEEQGQLSTLQAFAEEHVDEETKEIFPAIDFTMASGQRIDLELIRSLLDFRRDNGGRITQMPRLFVCEECLQVIWALRNYTGKAGDTGACKDVIDVLRYMASAELLEVSQETFRVKAAGEWGGEEDE